MTVQSELEDEVGMINDTAAARGSVGLTTLEASSHKLISPYFRSVGSTDRLRQVSGPRML